MDPCNKGAGGLHQCINSFFDPEKQLAGSVLDPGLSFTLVGCIELGCAY